jgi:hypothetical protein
MGQTLQRSMTFARSAIGALAEAMTPERLRTVADRGEWAVARLRTVLDSADWAVARLRTLADRREAVLRGPRRRS